MRAPRPAALPPACSARHQPGRVVRAPEARPRSAQRRVIQINVTVALPGRLAWLLAAAGTVLQILGHGR